MGIGGWVKRRAKDAKRTAEKAKRKAEEAARATARKAEDAKREAERFARAKAAAAKRQAERAAKELTVGLIDDIKDVASAGKREIEAAAKTAAAKAVDEVEDTLTEKVPDLIGEAFQALAKALTSEALEKVRAMLRVAVHRMDELRETKPALVDEINNLGFSVELGPVTLKYSGFYDRSDDLLSALGAPPALRRSAIRDFVSATAPTSADLGISVQVVAVVVGSKELGIGGGFDEIGGALVVELLDAILEAAGVPE